ncbi:MAG TPA: hypothetical protein VJT31_34365 [Rugosimonospora sp.]|nr:hypothetical protein [Rugosimonospora sp.]
MTGIYIKLGIALIVGLTVAGITAVSGANALSPDNQVATIIQRGEATQPNVLNYGSR